MELEGLYEEFAQHGIDVVAVTSNPKELAEQSVAEWELSKLPVGYGLPIAKAEEWGLFVSAAIKDTEPDRFSEPGTFVIRPDQTLYASIVQTMPFSRVTGAQLLSSLQFIVENDYPARGEVPPSA